MLQRIQTVYLLIAALISGGLIFVLPLWTTPEGVDLFAIEDVYVFAGFIASAVLSVITIFYYKNRQTQFVIGRLNIILNFILLGVFVYQSLTLPGGASASEKGIGLLVPVFSIVFLALANKAIKKDEALVKSVDRLR